MGRVTYLTLLLAVILFATNLKAQSYSMEQAIQYALDNHNDIKRNYLDQTDAEWQVKEYLATGLPTLNGNVNYQYFFELPTTILPKEFVQPGQPAEVQFGTTNNLTAGLTADFLLFDPGFFTGLKAQRAFKELIASEIGETERDVRVNVVRAYLNVLVLKETYDIIDDNIAFIQTTRDETEAMYEAGFAEQLDVDRLDLSLQNLRTQIDNVEQSIESSKIILKYHMGYPIGEEITLADDINVITAKNPVEQSLNTSDFSFEDRVEIGLVDQSIELTDMNIRSIKARYWPTLTGVVEYNQSLQTNDLFSGDDSWFPTGVAGLNLSVPIFDGRDKKSKIERARVQQEELILQRNDLERLIEMEVRTSKINVENNRRILNQRKASEELAEKIYDTTLVKYREGVGSSLEVNQAEIDMLTAQQNYIEALFDYLMARTDLERALGKI